ncbi:hypothetical protein AAAT91_06900, partial [Bacteroides uniformis]|uniref:hypothetical protein n=1 Tax=Bacteroides uniformis TaxID=820 RepID=UPI0032C0E329
MMNNLAIKNRPNNFYRIPNNDTTYHYVEKISGKYIHDNNNISVNAFTIQITYNTLLGNVLLLVSTQFRASPFERALFSALNRVLLIN